MAFYTSEFVLMHELFGGNFDMEANMKNPL